MGEGGGPEALPVEVRRVEAAAGDERWSCGGSTAPPRWLGPAMAHGRGGVVAAAGGSRAEKGWGQFQKVLQPFGLVHWYTAGAGVYARPLPACAPPVGTAPTQQSERNPLTLRTRSKRLARKTMWCSTSGFRPDTGMGLLVNRYEVGTPI